MQGAGIAVTGRDGIVSRVRQDLRHYARVERTALNLTFACRMIFVTPGFQFVLLRRVQDAVVRVPVVGRVARRLLWWATCLVFGSELGLAAKIGGGLYIPHPFGIVVGICEVGRDVAIMQNVTIGRRSPLDDGAPRIGDGALLSAGCVVLGNVTVGAGSIVGANAVVTDDVPADAVAVGAPARARPRRAVSAPVGL